MSDRSSDKMLSLVTTITMNPSSAELQSSHLASPTAQGTPTKSSSSSEPASASKALAKQQGQSRGDRDRDREREREREREKEREREREKDKSNSQASMTVVAKPPQEEVDIITQISSFFKNLIFSDPAPPIPTQPTHTADNWQANYLSPVHTKLKKEGKIPVEKEKTKDVEWLLKHHFKGILPYFRVWEIKMEEMDADPPTIGRGTPPFPNRPIFNREMIATKLFLKDYGKRRGLTKQNSSVAEEVVEVKSLRKSSTESKPSFSVSRTQSLSPGLIKRRKNSLPHRASSKLIS